MKNQILTDAQLEATSGGIQNLFIGGNAGMVVDNSINNSGNTFTLTQVDASTDISDSFNQDFYARFFSF